MHKLRLRVLALLVALGLAAVATVAWTALPLWSVVGVAVAATAFVVNTMTSRLGGPTCWGCGADLSREPGCGLGVACPTCGCVNQTYASRWRSGG